MKPILLELKAFGPYRDKQVIDFTQLQQESIFLITGPTGAGKTTIFDAICYSLYGKASGSDRDQDTFRSHFAKDIDATEVSFQFTLKNKEYRVDRNPRQFKLKARGEGYTEDPAAAQLYQRNSEEKWQLLSSKIKDVNDDIQEIIGLDYEQFKKMIMIPQGEFRKLISENSRDREEVLQKIFHTYFYAEISNQLKEEAKELKTAMGQLDVQINQEIGRFYSDKNQEAATDNTMKSFLLDLKNKKNEMIQHKKLTEKQQNQRQKDLKNSQQHYFAAKRIEEKYQQKYKLELEKNKLLLDEDEMNNNKEAISKALEASKILPYEEKMKEREMEWKAQKKRVVENEERRINLEIDYKKMNEKFKMEKANEEKRLELKENINQLTKQLEKIKDYQKLNEDAETTMQRLEKLKNERMMEEEGIKKAETRIKTLRSEIDNIANFYEDKQKTEKKLDREKEKISSLAELDKELKVLENLRQNYQHTKVQYQEMKQQCEKTESALEELEIQNRSHHANYLAKNLLEGHACPVCGSTHHPQKATNIVSAVSDKEILTLQNRLKMEKDKLNGYETDYIEVKSTGQAQKQLVERLWTPFKEEIEELNSRFVQKVIQESNRKLKVNEQLLADVNQKLLLLTKSKNEIIKLEEDLHGFKVSSEKNQEEERKIKEDFYLLQAKKDAIAADFNDEITTEKTHIEKLNYVQHEYDQMVEEWEKAEKNFHAIKEKMQTQIAVCQEAEKFLNIEKTKYETQKQQYLSYIQASSFTNEDEYLAAKLSDNERSLLEERYQNYQEKMKTTTKELEQIITELTNIEKPDLIKMEEQLEKLEEAERELAKQLEGLRLKLEEIDYIESAIEKLAKQRIQLEEQYFDVGELANLAKGDNIQRLSFERYVLSTFLDEILLQANIRLDKMTDNRYQLIRSTTLAKRGAQSGLDLEVLDQYTGQQRSVKTLSGGEGFKAALSLALGMSDIIQAYAGGVQLDTLFIDEGFGTLDEVSLEQAIECLKDLQADQRLIGIISHVPQLKEEIRAKLQITASPTGSSATFQL